MKLEIARGLFLLVALAVASVAFAAWEEPRPQVLSSIDLGAQCPLPRTAQPVVTAQPDHDLLLFLFGMSRGLRSNG